MANRLDAPDETGDESNPNPTKGFNRAQKGHSGETPRRANAKPGLSHPVLLAGVRGQGRASNREHGGVTANTNTPSQQYAGMFG